jgi:hypothetical protein
VTQITVLLRLNAGQLSLIVLLLPRLLRQIAEV